VRSYYDAIDFKEFEGIFLYQSWKQIVRLSIYAANISSRRILNSYAKLDAIEVKIIAQSENEAILLAKTKWITHLRSLKSTDTKSLKIDGKWFIKPKKNSLDIPPNQFLSSNTTEFFKHVEVISTNISRWRFKTTCPEILSANLIQLGKRIHRDRWSSERR
jgi:hypothetical protein